MGTFLLKNLRPDKRPLLFEETNKTNNKPIEAYEKIGKLPELCKEILNTIEKLGWIGNEKILKFYESYLKTSVTDSSMLEEYECCFKHLVPFQSYFLLNYVNCGTGLTFLHYAAEKERWAFIDSVLKDCLDEIGLPVPYDNDLTTLLRNAWSSGKVSQEVNPVYSQSSCPGATGSYVYYLLKSNKRNECIEAVKTIFSKCVCGKPNDQPSHTQRPVYGACGENIAICLQYAIIHEKTEEAEVILENCKEALYSEIIYQAARLGYPDLLLRMIGKIKENRLDINCILVKPDGQDTSVHVATETQSPQHLECLRVLLDNISPKKWQFQLDYYGLRAIDCAGIHYNREASLELVKRVTHLSALVRDDKVAPAIAPHLIETYFNNQVTDVIGRIQINYAFLAQPISKLDMPLLALITTKQEQNRALVKNAVVATYIDVMWTHLRKWFYINGALFLIFSFLLTGYTCFLQPHQFSVSIAMRVIILVFLLWISAREIIQAYSFPRLYIITFDNYVEWAMIASTGFIVLVFDCGATYQLDNLCSQFNGAAIFFTWLSFLCLVRSHPFFSLQTSIFIKVFKNFSYFLIPYAIIIFTFSLSFYTIFREEVKNNNVTDFAGLGSSFMKVVIMSGGEYDAGFLAATSKLAAYIGMVLFILLISMLMVNLLIAFSVADIKDTKEAADVIALCARARHIVATLKCFLVLNTLWNILTRCGKLQTTEIKKMTKGESDIEAVLERGQQKVEENGELWEMTIDYNGDYKFITPQETFHGKLSRRSVIALRDIKMKKMESDS